jgi:hypothetical protein
MMDSDDKAKTPAQQDSQMQQKPITEPHLIVSDFIFR